MSCQIQNSDQSASGTIPQIIGFPARLRVIRFWRRLRRTLLLSDYYLLINIVSGEKVAGRLGLASALVLLRAAIKTSIDDGTSAELARQFLRRLAKAGFTGAISVNGGVWAG